MSSVLKIEDISYQFEEHDVLQGINMTVAPQQTVGILGTSGVGNTTLFNLIASNLAIQSGHITINDSKDIKGKISYMLQKDMLFQHKTVVENIMLPLIIKGVSSKAARMVSEELLEEFGLDKWANYYPNALSGGMRQRIAFLRTINFDRQWLLLDEAFGALDAITRRNMHEWFMEVRQKMNWSTLLITHDVEEALILCDTIYVIKGQPGKIVKKLDVKLSKEKFSEVIYQPEFLAYKRELLEALSND